MGIFPLLILLAIFAAPVGFAVSWFAIAHSRRNTRRVAHGRQLLEQGELEDARRVFEAISTTPDDPGFEPALYWLGRTLEELGRTKEAEEAYSRYLDDVRDPSPVTLRLVRERLNNLGASYWRRYNEAHALLWARAAQAEPATPPATAPPAATKTPPPPLRLARDLATLSTGQRVGAYTLAEKIGEGGFGTVYRAIQPVAVKLARSPEAVEHLRRFGMIQSKVSSPRIVKPLEISLDSDPPYIVMEFVDGPTLRELLRARRLSPAEAIALLREVALGLADAHDGGVLHLDLKPENVLIGSDGAVKLTDFELGRLQSEAAAFRMSQSLASVEKDGRVAGTIPYMSPEQREGRSSDARSDVYTFGVMLFEALTGEHPQPGDRPSQFVPGLAPELDRIFEKCFARSERRYASARELARDLEALVAKTEAVDLGTLVRRFALDPPAVARAEPAPVARAEPAPVATRPPIELVVAQPAATEARPPIDEAIARAREAAPAEPERRDEPPPRERTAEPA